MGFTVMDEKRFLNYNDTVRAQQESDISGYIRKADANWPVAKTLKVIHLLTRRFAMKKMLVIVGAVAGLMCAGTVSFASEMGDMANEMKGGMKADADALKGEMKGEMKAGADAMKGKSDAMKAKVDSMKASKDAMKDEMKAKKDAMKGDMQAQKDSMKATKDAMKGSMKDAMGY